MNAKILRISDVERCPLNRLDAAHYRVDGSCLCGPPETCEDRSYECCDLNPLTPGDDAEYERHVRLYRAYSAARGCNRYQPTFVPDGEIPLPQICPIHRIDHRP